MTETERERDLLAYNERLKAQIEVLARAVNERSRLAEQFSVAECALDVVDVLVGYLQGDGRPGVIQAVAMYQAIRSRLRELSPTGTEVPLSYWGGQSNMVEPSSVVPTEISFYSGQSTLAAVQSLVDAEVAAGVDPAPQDRMTRQQLRELLTVDPPEGLGFCGCGMPEESVKLLRDTLCLYDRQGDSPWSSDSDHSAHWDARQLTLDALLPDPFRQIWLYWLTCVDLLEHGGSVEGSWLSDKGKQVYAALKEHGDDVLDD